MGSETVFERLREIVAAQLGCGEDTIKPETHLYNDLGADSLDMIEMAITIEDKFDVVIPDGKLDEIKSVQDAINFLVDRI